MTQDIHLKEQGKVLSANKIYSFVAEAIRLCHELKIIWGCENPTNSWFWEIPPIKLCSEMSGVTNVVFDACMHGGERPKSTRISRATAQTWQF